MLCRRKAITGRSIRELQGECFAVGLAIGWLSMELASLIEHVRRTLAEIEAIERSEAIARAILDPLFAADAAQREAVADRLDAEREREPGSD